MRFDIPLDIEFKTSIDTNSHYKGMTVNFSRTGLCFETNEHDCTMSNLMELKVKMPEKDDYISVTGDLAWKAKADDAGCIVGISFTKIDNEAKSEILNHAYDAWLLNFQK